MNVLLVYPEFPDTFWSFKHALRFIRKKAAYPPLGLLTVASMLPRDWSRRLVDLNVRDLTAEDLAWADCALIERRRQQRGFHFNTQVAINLADDFELMGTMVAAGFDTVFVGIETPNQESLAECSKHHNLGRDMTADVRRLERAGLQVQGGFILGFDSDTPRTFDRLLEFIQSTGIVTAMVGLLQAISRARRSRLPKSAQIHAPSSFATSCATGMPATSRSS